MLLKFACYALNNYFYTQFIRCCDNSKLSIVLQNYETISCLPNILRNNFIEFSQQFLITTLKFLVMSDITDIKKFRELHGLTQRQLAERCGVTLRTVQNWEMGRNIPDSAIRLLQHIESEGETISSSSTDNGISVAAGNGSNVNVSSEAARLITLLEKQQEQTDEHLQIIKRRDVQIDRLINVIAQMTDKRDNT